MSEHDTPEAVEAMCATLTNSLPMLHQEDGTYCDPAGFPAVINGLDAHEAAAMLRRLHAGTVAAEKQNAARAAAAWCAAIEAAAETLEAEAAHYTEWSAGELCDGAAAAIRALTPPASYAAALEAVRREARKEACREWREYGARVLSEAGLREAAEIFRAMPDDQPRAMPAAIRALTPPASYAAALEAVRREERAKEREACVALLQSHRAEWVQPDAVPHALAMAIAAIRARGTEDKA